MQRHTVVKSVLCVETMLLVPAARAAKRHRHRDEHGKYSVAQVADRKWGWRRRKNAIFRSADRCRAARTIGKRSDNRRSVGHRGPRTYRPSSSRLMTTGSSTIGLVDSVGFFTDVRDSKEFDDSPSSTPTAGPSADPRSETGKRATPSRYADAVNWNLPTSGSARFNDFAVLQTFLFASLFLFIHLGLCLNESLVDILFNVGD